MLNRSISSFKMAFFQIVGLFFYFAQ